MSQAQMDREDSFREEDAASEKDKKQKSRRPANTAFRQQRLKAWQPILTPKTVLPLFFAVGVIFAPIGGLLLYASAQVQQIKITYQDCTNTDPAIGAPLGSFAPIPSQHYSLSFKNSTPSAELPRWSRSETSTIFGVGGASVPNYSNVTTPVCLLQFYIPDEIGPPVFFYYQMTNFYQNHRRYVKSFDRSQLSGQFRSNDSIAGSDCDPLRVDPETNKTYYPCGLIANSLFNDTFSSPVKLNVAGDNANNETYDMVNKGIAWTSDRDLYGRTAYTPDQVVPPVNWRYKYPRYDDTQFPIPNLQEMEEFQVWMRTAGLPVFSKLARRNDTAPMSVGRYEVRIEDFFPVTIYDGTKSILISTRTVMGGQNPFLGIAYVVVAGVCVVMGALFLATHLIKPRKLGDHSYLTWSSDQPANAITTPRIGRRNGSS
ncbi:Meiotically up-regulated protein 89 protein [Sphaceloma murrayae]|uniref:Meiotically up-regulated protein 89 protein n=1 Tax=Sphaceloma murrayae TaxID=2082308 RepID=A0A2K1QY35_9PEZI|nr:Meiotically up-regulated protein 89 protein [Sphaceloma murrayae]